MYDFWLGEFGLAIQRIENCGFRLHGRKGLEDRRAALANEFEAFGKLFRRLEFEAACDQVDIIVRNLRRGTPLSEEEFAIHCRSLLQSIRNAANKARFYYYPNRKADELHGTRRKWKVAFEAFPSIKEEVTAGVDLWALGRNTASVFHLIRAAEIGLRLLAKKMGVKFAKKPTEWGQWGDLLKALDGKVTALRQTTNGPKRDAELRFYSEAVTGMKALAERRDAVMHVRRDFDEHEAASTIDRVHDLLTGLASRVRERPKK